MKKVFLFFVLFISLVGYSQNGISYQALILNPSGEELPGVNNPNAPLSNKLICLKFSILDSNSTIEYLETHTVTTDAHGIVNLIIGTGDQIGGYASSFGNIVWNNTPKNLKVELDVRANCTYFVEISNQPFTYVPFAYYAANANVANATTLSTGIIQLAGDLGGTGTTATAPIISNNAITSAKILNGAVTPIKIASGANNTVLVTDATGNVAWVDRASFGAVADMTTIEGAGTSASPFKVKDLGIVTNKIADNAVTTSKIANGAITNAKIGEVISVPNGGTGASTLTGYVKGNGTAPMTAVTSIPVADISGAQTTANLSNNIASNTGSTTLYPSVAAVETFVANNATPDATTTVKGKVKLAGDLGGTADLPTVPGLALKAPLASPALTGTPTAPTPTTGDSSTQIATTAFVSSEISTAVSANATPDATTTVKGKVKLAGDLGGTADLPTVPGLALKAPLASPALTGTPTAPTPTSGDSSTQIATTAFVSSEISTAVSANATPDATTTVKGKVQLAGDLGGTADLPTVPGLANKENTIAAGTTLQYWRGDKTWQTLDKSAVGLGNVDNTADSDKPISTAVQAALNTKENTANKSDVTTLGTSDVLFPTQNAVKTYVDNQIVANATPDATTTVKGKVQLAGDLGGTADLPTVPGLANKENTIAAGTTLQYWRGDKTWQTLDKLAVGLGNVDNTADADKPISTAVQAALNTKENTANKSDVTTLGTSDVLFPTQNAVKTYVDNQIVANATPDATTTVKGKVQLAGDLGGTADLPTVPGLANKENTIAAGTTLQYWRGDKTWQTLDKSAVGLGNVDNTADADKPISTAVQAALNTKENTANKSDVTTLGTSDVLFPTQNAVKTYVDNQIVANATPDATATVKGKLQLAGDLAGTGSSAANPVISNNAITTSKILDAAVTPSKIEAGSNDSVLVTDNTGTVVWIDKGAFGAVADLTSIEGVGTTANPFKVKDLGIITAKLANGAVTTAKLADDAVTNAKIGEIISLENGGTGSNMTTTAGYVKQVTTGANLSTVSTIPVTDVTGAVRSVNGVVPASDGNVAVIIGRVFTGATVNPDLATSIINASPAKQQSDIYIVADGSNPNNGRTFIYDGTNWLEVATDLSTTDARYVNVAGDTMEGDLIVPTGTKIIINDAPLGSTDAVNKAYVDGLITSSATPDATASIKGKIKLAGDLGGTADAPTVPDLALKAPLESPSLTGTPLAPTAAAGTNTTQIATTAFVTAATAGMQDAITLTTTGTGAASLVGSTLNIPTPNNGTVTEVSALSIGTSGTDITSTVATATTTPVVTLNVPTASAANRGALSATDWTTFNNKIGGSGTTNFVPKFTGSATIGDSSIFDDGTNVGIGTASPANTLEIKQGTAGNSGLRFTNLTASSSATTSSNKVLGVDSNGDVILTNIPGTQNIVSFSTATPTTSGVVFTPNTPTDQSVVYQSIVDNSLWTYNGTAYVTYTAPASTAWNLGGTTNDAGSNKTSSIWRSGGLIAGGTSSSRVYGNLTGFGGSGFTGVPPLGTASVGLISNSSAGWTGSGFLFSNSTVGTNAFSMVYNTDRAYFGQLTPSNTSTMFGVWSSTGLLLGANANPMNRLDVLGGVAIGSYAGANTAPSNGLIVSGNVGIGTVSPSSTLHVNNPLLATNSVNADAQVLRLSRPQTINQKWDNIAQFNLGSYSNSTVSATSRLDLALNDGAGATTSNVMTWQANGYVGVGTTTPYSQFANTNVNTLGSDAIGTSTGGLSWVNNNIGYAASIFNSGTTSSFNGLAIKIAGNQASNTALNISQGTTQGTAGTSLLSVLGNGNVGIGTSAPLTKFIVNDNAYIANLPTSTANLMDNTTFRPLTRFQTTSGINNNALSIYDTTTAFALQAHNYSTGATLPLNLQTAGGSIGIGTTTPYSQLANTASTIQGSIISSVNGGFNWVSPGSGFAHSVYSSNTIGGGAQVKVAGNTSNVYAFEVSQATTQTGITTPLFNVIGNGNVGVGTNSPAAQFHTTGSVRFAGAGTPGNGRVLTSDASGNATWQSVNFATAVTNRTTDFTLTAADSGSVIVVNSATTVTITIPSTLSAGYYCQIIQQGAGQVNVVGSGVTVTSAMGTYSRTTGSSVGIMLTSSTAAFLSGDTAF